MKTPRILSMNLGVQQQLPRDVILDVSYVGTLGRHLLRTIDLDQLRAGTLLNPPNSSINPNALRPYLGYSAVGILDTGDNSNYNSLQVGVRRRVSRGLSVGANYTFSKTL